ncbi:similarity to FOLATE TRANSPORTER [Encephalitozoon cuniculi GB-M1]|uniref:Similarity to FOLATE TRANSPORTER n=2 Tax=Encephalitozoon cuniculi TaxID=6035 RepID=Q8SU14_ENCCU|nr:uncharacterized protein ECU11_1600 [Encephalitozoon cuniculi GB-M1]AGE94886.1 folate transporter [Encephalitozoon cuniculi]KMV65118.1 hypothetical protein M970_111600 [Encephalitozoon cuniculi EcunIII-L]UYI26367.1 putative MFS_1-like membrane transporter [Encephalitozoon cuniculi]CAD26070.1 similarity to FOLATE TRANSPORTER [Encephalitozoon cuniculi GB-M1]
MSWTTKLYQYFALKSFTPFLSFMVPYLVEQKGFHNKELHNNFSPLFFTSSIVISLTSFLIIELLGNKVSLFADTFAEMLVYLIFLLMPFKNRFLTAAVYVLHGATTSFGVVMKSILNSTADEKEDRKVILSTVVNIKTSVGVVSSWIGQDIIMCGGNHLVNISISLLGLFLALLTTLLLPASTPRREEEKFIDYIWNPTEAWKRIVDTYSYRVILASLLSSSASILYICLSFYSAGIFLEKRKNGAENSIKINRVLFFVAKPVRLVSYTVIRIFSRFDSSVSYHSNPNKPVIVHGYIEGCSKILSSFAGLQISRIISEDRCVPLALLTSTATVAFIYLLGASGSMSYSYLFYILASLSSSLCKTISNIGLQSVCEESGYKFVLGFNLFVSSIIHISITHYSRAYHLSVRSKLMAYFYVNAFFIMAAFTMYLWK